MSVKRFSISALCYAAVFFAALALLIYINNLTPHLHSGDVLQADLDEQSYALVLPPYQKDAGCFLMSFELPEEPLPPLSIAVTDIGEFRFFLEGEEIYSLSLWDKSSHMHVISLGVQPDRNQDGTLQLAFELAPTERWKAIVIGSTPSISKMARFSSGLNAFIIGTMPVMILYAASLFYFKRSERYLFTFFGVAAISFVLVLIEYNTLGLPFPIWMNNLLRYPCIFFPTILTSALCHHLTEVSAGPLDRLFQPRATLLHLGVLTVLRVLYVPVLYPAALFASYLLGAYVLILACVKKRPFSWVLLIAFALRQAVRYVATLCTAGYFVAGELRIYFCTSPASDLIFLFACMLFINHRFASKFQEAETLSRELAEANAVLDAKVLSRTQQLSEANACLLREQETRHQMMLNIFHDLRGPLFVIQGNLDIISTQESDSQSTRLDIIRNKVLFLQRLIEDLFLIAKLEDHRISFLQEPVDLPALLRSSCAANLEAAHKKGLCLFLQLCGPLRMLGDPFRMEQILQNLLDNAFLYTPKGGRVTVALEREADKAVIRVTDTGPGISAQDIPHIFERYYHGNSPRRSESTGLGLSIVRELVLAQQGGDISVRSQPGQGSQFILRFPLYSSPSISEPDNPSP